MHLYFIQSPLQAINAFEARAAAESSAVDRHFAIRFGTVSAHNNRLVANTLRHLEWDDVVTVPFAPNPWVKLGNWLNLRHKLRRLRRTVLYSCMSGYPVAFEDIWLFEITRLRETFGSRVKEIGFSGHHLGIAADVAAMTLGATWIERHFTLDRTWKGTDHAASLEPDGMRRLVRDIHNVHKALSAKATELLPCEDVQRAKLKR